MSDLPTFQFERHFSAPRNLVWHAWTDLDLLSRWYGPNVETITHEFDFRPGGRWLVEMRHGSGSMFQRIEYLEVDPPRSMIWIHVSSDAEWREAPSEMMPDWPRKLRTSVSFAEDAGGTTVHLIWEPFEASEAEIAFFTTAVERMGGGWESGMRILDRILAELQDETDAAARSV